MKREPRQRKAESWQSWVRRYNEWADAKYTPEWKARAAASYQAHAQAREDYQAAATTSHQREEAAHVAAHDCFIELPINPGARAGNQVTRYVYCQPEDRAKLLTRILGIRQPMRRPVDRCQQRRPHPCFLPEGEPQWCYIYALQPLEHSVWLPTLEPENYKKEICIHLCCPQAARLQIRELHAQHWRGIRLTTECPNRDTQQFVRYMQVTMPCLNQ